MASGTLSQEEMEDLRRSIADLVLRDLKRTSVNSEDQNDVKKRRSFRDKLVNDVPLTGLNEAVKSKRNAAAVFWTIIFLGCVTATVYFIYRVFEEYATQTTATKVKLERQEQYVFPPFVLCVDTWLDMDKALELGFSPESVKYAMSYLVAPYEIFSNLYSQLASSGMIGEETRPSLTRSRSRTIGIDPAVIAKLRFDEAYKKQNFTNLLEFFEAISLKAVRSSDLHDEISFDCIFCTDSELTKVIIDHDVCYKINLWDVHAGDGHTSGWYELKVRVPDRSSGVQSRRKYWKLYAAPRMTHFVQPGTFKSIQNDYTHTISVTTERAISLNTEKEPCEENANYSRRACAFECLAKFVKKHKNCTLFNLDTEFSSRSLDRYCNLHKSTTWIEEIAMQFITYKNFTQTTEEQEDMEEECSKCLPECAVQRYRTEMDTHQSRTLSSMRSNGENRTTAKIFFVNADVVAGGIMTLTEVDTYSFETLVSNIGGVCGIWIGASVLTFVQLFAFFSKLCVGCGRRHFRPKLSGIRRENVAMLNGAE